MKVIVCDICGKEPRPVNVETKTKSGITAYCWPKAAVNAVEIDICWDCLFDAMQKAGFE